MCIIIYVIHGNGVILWESSFTMLVMKIGPLTVLPKDQRLSVVVMDVVGIILKHGEPLSTS
jgi:hypothetical protein